MSKGYTKNLEDKPLLIICFQMAIAILIHNGILIYYFISIKKLGRGTVLKCQMIEYFVETTYTSMSSLLSTYLLVLYLIVFTQIVKTKITLLYVYITLIN